MKEIKHLILAITFVLSISICGNTTWAENNTVSVSKDDSYGGTGIAVKQMLHLPWIYNELEYSSKQRSVWFNQLVQARKQYNQYLAKYGITRNINARYWRYTSSGKKVRKPYYNDLKKIYSTAGSFKKIFFGYNYAKEFPIKGKWVYQV